MNHLRSLVEGYQQKHYRRVPRNDISYNLTDNYISAELSRKIAMYQEQFEENQTARLIRDDIDNLLRRRHGYCVEGSIGGHYREIGAPDKGSVFEHVIPISSVRDMLIESRLTIKQALNTPVCLVKKTSDKLLNGTGLASTSPNNYFFFQRYAVLNAKIKTYNGQLIENLDTWSLQDHYDFFGI